MLRKALLLLTSYAAAAPLTAKISIDMTKTEWTNIWTYVWWISSLAIWSFIVGFSIFAFVAIRNSK